MKGLFKVQTVNSKWTNKCILWQRLFPVTQCIFNNVKMV